MVACETLNVRATSACASPAARRCSASWRWCGVILRGRPNRTPRSLARFRPSPVRARISSRSNSAKPPRTVSISRPCAVVVSAHVSLSERKPAPRFPISSSTLSRARDDENITWFETADHLGKLRPVGLGARYLLFEHLGAAGGHQLGILGGQVLISGRYADISEKRHDFTLHFDNFR